MWRFIEDQKGSKGLNDARSVGWKREISDWSERNQQKLAPKLARSSGNWPIIAQRGLKPRREPKEKLLMPKSLSRMQWAETNLGFIPSCGPEQSELIILFPTVLMYSTCLI